MSDNNDIIDDGLTDEERAALADEDAAIEQPPAGTADPETPVAQEAKAQTPEIQERPAEAPEAPAETETPQQAQPILVANSPADADARLQEISTKKDELLTQFDDGDITAREYQKQLDDLSRQERKIEFEQHEAQLAQKMEQQRLQNDWTATCNAFIERNAIYKDNPRLYKALDEEVRELAGKPETANWTGQRFLDEAHKNLKAAFGFKDAAAPAPTASRELPPNLAKVPAAEVEDTNGGRFAVLDRMATSDPMGYEETLSKMSQSERDAYLAS